MIKRVFSVFLSAMFVTFFTVAQASALTMDLSISDTDITVGESFSIGVWANDAAIDFDEVLAFGFDNVNSDGSIVSYDGYTIGSEFSWDDSSWFIDTDVAGSVGFGPGITDAGILLATLDYTALSDGDVTLGISSDMMDFNEGLVYLWDGSVDITSSLDVSVASSAAPVPEPATIFLLGIGLVGMAGFRKRFRK